jgi:hypothetical protein
MLDQEFIHSKDDVTSTLTYALDSGLRVRLDEAQSEPVPRMLTRPDIAEIERGNFEIFRPDWLYGPFETMAIRAGHNAGKYVVSPRVNYTAISIYFQGERVDQGRRRFGECVVSFHPEWLEMPAKLLRASPADVQEWLERIVERLSSGVVIKAGVHRYQISRGVLADPRHLEYLPPFDFIPWPAERELRS